MAAYAQRAAGAGAVPPLVAVSRVWYNEELSSRNMIVPGLIAVIMMIIAAMLTSLTIAREWERGTMEQLAATPVTRGRGRARQAAALPGHRSRRRASRSRCSAWCSSACRLRGSVLLLAVLTSAFLIGALGLGLFISAVANSQLLATQMAMIATFLPAFLLSGFMFAISVDAAGPAGRHLSRSGALLPGRHAGDLPQGRGRGGAAASRGCSMIAFAVLGLLAAMLTFQKELA